MARKDNEVRITLSVLDRLVRIASNDTGDLNQLRPPNLRDLKQAVRRDLEWLLNTRQMVGGIPAELKECSTSLAAFGLPDFSNVSVKSVGAKLKMRHAIEDTIRNFEPRLQDVVVTLESTVAIEQAVRFRIDANLIVDPEPEPVTFDTTLQLNSGQYEVKGE